MKQIILGILFIFMSSTTLVGCGESGGSGNSDQTQPTPPPDKPLPLPVELHWGELKCQKRSNCPNQILNLSLNELGDFFAQEFAWNQEFNSLPKEERIFRCSTHLAKVWDRHFEATIKVPPSEWADFLIALFDSSQCKLKNDFNDQLKNYFKNTKEYLNESN